VVPLLRSRNDKRYKIETAGKSRASSFRNNDFSLTDVSSTSESLGAGVTRFSGGSRDMVTVRVSDQIIEMGYELRGRKTGAFNLHDMFAMQP
jgi:cell envelope opacity-associated protein A